ncbi:hypothetical protein AB0J52_15360 [Spirillospora sp. NPDC049652]
MSVQDVSAPPAAAVRPPIFTRAFVTMGCLSFGGMASCYLLMSTMPLFAARHGRGGFGAGLTTGAMMLATIGRNPTAGRPWRCESPGRRRPAARSVCRARRPAPSGDVNAAP